MSYIAYLDSFVTILRWKSRDRAAYLQAYAAQRIHVARRVEVYGSLVCDTFWRKIPRLLRVFTCCSRARAFRFEVDSGQSKVVYFRSTEIVNKDMALAGMSVECQ
jgi:hypothetical protein